MKHEISSGRMAKLVLINVFFMLIEVITFTIAIVLISNPYYWLLVPATIVAMIIQGNLFEKALDKHNL
jgi:hypothetical protein